MNKLFSNFIRKFKAMSLVEVMVGLLVITCISAAFSPVMVKRFDKLPVSIKNVAGITEECSPPFKSACTLCMKHPSKCLQCSKTMLACNMDEYANTRKCECVGCSTLDVNCVKCANKDKCLQCKVGYYPDGKKCIGCPAGYYCPDGINKVECGEGNYCPPDPDDEESDGNVGYNTEPIPCPKGKKCPCCTAKQPEPCGAGHYQDQEGQGECKECDQGYKCPVPVCNGDDENCGNTRQIPCQPKEFQDLKGQTTCKGCDPGNMCPSQAMTGQAPCPAGQYQDLSGQTACKNCNSGHACPEGGTDKLDSSTACPKGKYTPSDDNGYENCLDCPAGQYQDLSGQTACKNCDPGKYQNSTGQTACKNCNQGQYQNSTGQTACKDCNPGQYQNSTGQTACKDCNPGQYQDIAGKTSCLSCTIGNMCPASGASEPTACSSGQYQDTTGQTACKSCDSKVEFCSVCEKDDGTCTQCKSGFNLCDGQCKCAADHYLSGGTCVNCPSGLHTKACNTETVCTPCGDSCLGVCNADGTCEGPCNKGYYKNTSTNKCVPCPAGQYQNSTGQTSCKPCTKGHYCPNEGMSTPITCLAGKYQDAEGQTECKPCNTGYYCPADGATTRTSCLAGNYTPNSGNRKICTNCNNGYYCPANTAYKKTSCNVGQYTPDDGGAYKACLNCACGKTSNSGKNGCVNCGSGEYSNASACSTVTTGHYLAADKCSMKACEPGSYQDVAGRTYCNNCTAGHCKGCTQSGRSTNGAACDAGTYCAKGQTACTKCSAGHCRGCHNEGKGSDGAECNAGTYCTVGQTACSSCGTGKYQDETGKSACKSCTAGHCKGCNTTGKTANGAECDVGTYCTGGQSACSKCSAGNCRGCNITGRTANGNPCNKGTSCTAGQTACATCPTGQYQDEEGKSSCKACNSKTTHCTACNRTTGACTACAVGYKLSGSSCVYRCESGWLFVNSGDGAVCMYKKHNITSTKTTSVKFVNYSTSCNSSGTTKCCWKTAAGAFASGGCSGVGCASTVCNYEGALQICKDLGGRLASMKAYHYVIDNNLAGSVNMCAQKNPSNGYMPSGARCDTTSQKCVGSSTGEKCYPQVYHANYSTGSYAQAVGFDAQWACNHPITGTGECQASAVNYSKFAARGFRCVKNPS